jgi:hypothetical protein
MQQSSKLQVNYHERPDHAEGQLEQQNQSISQGLQ